MNNFKLSRLGVVQTGVVLAALYGLLGLFYTAFFVLFGVLTLAGVTASGGSSAEAFGGAVGMITMGLIFPVMMAIMGFIGGVIVAAIYNLVAKVTGGIEVTLTEA